LCCDCDEAEGDLSARGAQVVSCTGNKERGFSGGILTVQVASRIKIATTRTVISAAIQQQMIDRQTLTGTPLASPRQLSMRASPHPSHLIRRIKEWNLLPMRNAAFCRAHEA
jgi:hypothetical protein